jgi:hypothetical protein
MPDESHIRHLYQYPQRSQIMKIMNRLGHVVLFLIFCSTAYAQETIIGNIDLSKGSAPGGEVKGGKFMEQGWQITSPSDQIRFTFPNAASISSGYIEIQMTNVAPHPQSKAVPGHPGKNQFIGLNENCALSGIKVRYRHGTNYAANVVKTEIHLKDGDHWIEKQHRPLANYGDPSLNIVHRIEWDSKGFRLSLNGKEFQSFPNVPKGFCTVTIGETFYPTAQAFPGPIYKSVKYVSRSGGTPAPTPSGNRFSLSLAKGWNLASLPLVPGNTSPSALFSSIAGKYSAVYAYTGQGYQTFIPGESGNDLTSINAGKGYWIYMEDAATLSIEGSAASKSVSLSEGWNLVGYNSTTSAQISSALSSIAGKYEAVYAFDSAANSYKSHIPGGESDLTQLEPGKGYWIYMTQSSNWTLP